MPLIKNLLIRLLRNPAGRYYKEARLDKAMMPNDPLVLFTDWFNIARRIDPERYNAMTLATATAKAAPSARMVLLKSFDAQGFVFFTNYGSRKSQELAANPQAALVLWWKEIYRQVRIEGRVEKITPAASDAYFATRGRGSQLGAWASHQSSIIENRAVLEERLKQIETRFAGKPVPRPPFWGGFRLIPDAIDFWQGRQDRLHDRLHFYRREADWHLERLAP
ncbi:Pyridoxamine 5'-phosphate oxidase [hydrothermal vent metagenome]|uniref:Pyridoxamine 5'-phosphate oxidase n=1 Tax=hydrothermal vent metagenome TaxID=652676 RepID=A0A3B0UQU2_9ZZZZ